MARYIDADAVKKYILETGFYCDTYADREYSAEIIDTFPTEDVVQVVRCKDCKWFNMSDIGGTIPPIVYRCKRFARTYREAEDYCSYGERKDGEQDG